jgi:hypothetical protein
VRIPHSRLSAIYAILGVHQRGRPADIFEAGVQFHHRQGPGGGDHRNRLVEGQGLGWPAFLAVGGVGQGRDVAAALAGAPSN